MTFGFSDISFVRHVITSYSIHYTKLYDSIIFPMFFGISTINAQLLTDLNTVNLIKKMLIVFIINNSMTHKRYI